MDTTEKVKSRWTRSFFTTLNTRGVEERYVCDICQKDFASPSNLALHSQVHVIERKFKCEPCQVSFHSQGHLQKHKRSSAHETRVEMTQVFGVPTSDNPRPYGCPECDTAFRKHGHLAKHLRSKSHITKLEANGLIPIGTYAALEKSGQDLKDKLVTTNCEQSLRSLRQIAMHLFHQQPMPDESLGHTSEPLDGYSQATSAISLSSSSSSSAAAAAVAAHHSPMPCAPAQQQQQQHFVSRSSPPSAAAATVGVAAAPQPAQPAPLQQQAPLHLHQQQSAPLSLPQVTMPSSNMMMAQPLVASTASVSQSPHAMHPAHHSPALAMGPMNGNHDSQMIMMNMLPHLAQTQSLDYTLPPPTTISPESVSVVGPAAAPKVSMMNDPYSHLGVNLDNKHQIQQQQLYDPPYHQPQQQHHQHQHPQQHHYEHQHHNNHHHHLQQTHMQPQPQHQHIQQQHHHHQQQQQQQHQQHLHHQHHHQQQQQQQHQQHLNQHHMHQPLPPPPPQQQQLMPASNFAGYHQPDGQQMTLPMAPTMSLGPTMGPSCPTTTGITYMRH